MSPKTHTVEQIAEELKAMKSNGNLEPAHLREITRECAKQKKWDLAMEAFQLIKDEKKRNMVIADLVEEFLLPAKEITQAKKFANYIVQEEEQEMKSLIILQIAIAEQKWSDAESAAESLMTPLSRNFAYLHLIEAYLMNRQKEKVKEAHKRILENARTIYDSKIRSLILRDIAIDLYFANHEMAMAKEAANLIPDETIKTLVLSKIGSSK